jgi:excisionase family DNA binding protein
MPAPNINPIAPIAMPMTSATGYSGLSRSKLYLLMNAGEIEAIKVGKRRLVLRKSLDAFIERQPRAPPAA